MAEVLKTRIRRIKAVPLPEDCLPTLEEEAPAAGKIEVISNEAHGKMIETMGDLVRLPTFSHGDGKVLEKGQQANRQLMEGTLSELLKINPQLHYRWLNSNGFPNLLVTTQNKMDPRLLFAGHTDIVDVGKEKELLRMKVQGQVAKGRGTHDMKGSIAEYLRFFAEAQIETGLQNLDMGLLLTSDEERSGADGTKHVMEQGLKPGVVFLPDGGYFGKMVLETKGKMGLTVRSKGVAAHGAYPGRGVNAMYPMLDFLKELSDLYPNKDDGGFNWYTTVTPSTIHGGTASTNVVCDNVEVKIDLRFIPSQDPNGILRKITALGRKHGIEVEETVRMQPYKTNTEAKMVQAYAQAFTDITLTAMQGIKQSGTDDGRFLHQDSLGRAAIVAHRTEGGKIHTPHEWTKILGPGGMEQHYQILKAWALTQAKI